MVVLSIAEGDGNRPLSRLIDTAFSGNLQIGPAKHKSASAIMTFSVDILNTFHVLIKDCGIITIYHNLK